MNFRKCGIGMLLFLFVVSHLAFAFADGPLQRGAFAEMLFNMKGLAFPASVDDPALLSLSERYDCIASLLSGAGTTTFIGANPDERIAMTEFIDSLYNVSSGNKEMELGVTEAQKMNFLVSRGTLPAEFATVAAVQNSLEQYLATNGSYPQSLDSASDGVASEAAPFFSTVLTAGVTSGWSKTGGMYSAPLSGAIFVYSPDTGTFETNSLVLVDFARQRMGL
jgi:hypothetical protein